MVRSCNVPFLALCSLVANSLFSESHRPLRGDFRVSKILGGFSSNFQGFVARVFQKDFWVFLGFLRTLVGSNHYFQQITMAAQNGLILRLESFTFFSSMLFLVSSIFGSGLGSIFVQGYYFWQWWQLQQLTSCYFEQSASPPSLELKNESFAT